MTLFRTFIVRSARQQPLRTAATVLSLAVGVAVVIAIQLANASSVRGFATVLDAVSGRTTLEVTAPGGLAETRLAALDWLRDYGLVSPVIDADVLLAVPAGGAAAGADPLPRPPGAPVETVRLLGVDILRDRPFRDYPLLVGDGAGTVTTERFLAVLTDPAAVVLTEAFANRHRLAVDDRVALLAGDRTIPLRIAGLLGDDGPARALDGNFALMDVAAAQWALDRLGFVDRVDVRLFDGVDVAAAEAAFADRLPAGLGVSRPSRRGAEVERMLRAFHFNLTALSLVALLVGLFLVYNTVSVSVITRQPEIGMLRTLGVSRRTVIALFLGEAAATAVVGSALGAPLGWLLAHGAVRLTSSTVSQFWVAAAAEVPPLDGVLVLMAFGVGVPLALLAAVVPAREAAGVSPVAAVRGDASVAARSRLRRRFVVGPVVLFALGAWLAGRDPVDGLPVFGLLAALAVVFGAAGLIPAVLFGCRQLAGPMLARAFGVAGRLAHASLGSAIPRLSISVAALSVSLAMMVAIAIMVGSFRATVTYWVGQTLQADLFVSTARATPVNGSGAISAETEARIAAHPEVVAIDAFTGIDVRYGDAPIVVGSGRFDVLLTHGALLFKRPAGDAGRAAMRGAIGTDAVVVSEAFSLKHGVDVGRTIQLPTPQGERPFRVAAVYYDYSNDRGLVVMDEATFARHYAPSRPAGLTVYLGDDAEPAAVREGLRATLGADRPLFINTNAALRRGVLEVFDATFAITYALEVIAVVVSMFGVAATLLTLVLERRHEMAVLRLIGTERRQIRAVIMIEAGTLGVLTWAVGLAVGFALSVILIYVINVQSFGWTIQFHLPIVFLVQSGGAVVLATTVAGVYPARLAARCTIEDLVTGRA